MAISHMGTISALMLLLLGGPSYAQLSPPAQEATQKGIIAAQQQEYLLAIRYFQDARKASPGGPVLLFNLGLAESKIAGRELRAMTWFQAYLVASPSAENAAAVNEQIKVLDVRSHINLSRLLKTLQQAASQLRSASAFVNPVHGALRRVSTLWAMSGDFAAALEVAGSIQNADSKADAQGSIAEAQATAGDIPGALQTANGIQVALSKGIALSAIAQAQARAGDTAGARQSLGAAAQIARTMEPPSIEQSMMQWTMVKAQAVIAERQAKSSDNAGAAEVLAIASNAANNIRRWEYKVRSQAAVAEGQARSGNGMVARQTFASALQTAASIREATDRSSALAIVAEAQARAGDKAGAAETFVLALQTVNGITDTFYKELGLRGIGRAQARAGDFSGAQKTADGIQNDAGMRAEVQRTIAKEQWGIAASQVGVDWTLVNDRLLNAPVFLDVVGYLKTIPTGDDRSEAFEALHEAAGKIIDAHRVIDQIQKKQARPRL